jgi:hypothetical protein
MASAVEICNLALGWLGAKLIAALDQENPASAEEELCAANYGAALKAVLEAKAWTFATARVELEPGEESGIAEYPRRFAIPGTVVRVLAVDDGTGAFDVNWVREGDRLLTDDVLDKAYVKAVLFVEDAAKFTPGFVRALAYRLAADLAMPLTENRARAEAMEALYERALAKGGALDGAQGSPAEKKTSWLRRARGG